MQASNIRMIFGMKLRQLRAAAGFSLQDLAKRSGLSPSYLNEIEKGKKYPKAERIVLLAQALDVDFDDLVSLKLEQGLDAMESVLNSPLIRKFPFHLFGITAGDVIGLLAKMPRRMGILARMLEDVAGNYDMRLEHFFHTALRSYQVIHRNYFDELENAAATFRREMGWAMDQSPGENELEAILVNRFGCQIDERDLADQPRLGHLRAVFIPSGHLMLNSKLNPAQRAFAIGRELGFRILSLTERSYSLPAMQVGTFEEVFNNFRAAYFAGALLMPKSRMLSGLRELFRQPTWQPARFLQWMQQFTATPEMFFYRLSEMIPHGFSPKRVHFLKFAKNEHQSSAQLTKSLNMSFVPIPNGIGLKEHFCQRWLSVKIIADIERGGGHQPLAAAQRSRFFDAGGEYFCISTAYRGNLVNHRYASVTIGFPVDTPLRRTIKFLKDPAIPNRELGRTCERCPLSAENCTERVAPPDLFLHKEELEKDSQALQRLMAQNPP